jgi:hypothetical protein
MNKSAYKFRLVINTAVPKDILYELITKNLKEQIFESAALERLPEFSQEETGRQERVPFLAKDMEGKAAEKMLDLFSASKIGIQALRADLVIQETGSRSADLIIDLAGPQGKSRRDASNELNIIRSLVWRLYSRLLRGLN